LDNYLHSVLDPIPVEILIRLDLPDLRQAIKNVHSPPKESSIDLLNRFDTPFHKRLIFDRFFLVMLSIASRKKSRERVSIPRFSVSWEVSKDLDSFFPFKLTSQQIQAIEDIKRDFTSGQPMNRLLQGDVGCGKTVVAAVAAYMAIQNNRQVAMMVPTQVLANQHMEYFSNLSVNMGFRPALLTGTLKEIERRVLYLNIRNGLYNLVVGTHSLIHEELSFSDLGLVIIDEQHRFGVRQRALMDKKGKNPHLLVMTATPIPRTLAITVYGDMSISVIKEYPEGHMPVVTHITDEGRKRWVFETLRQRMDAGQQAFVICPVILGSEDMDLKSAQEMAEKLRKILTPPYRIGLIHGRLSPDERVKIMDDFRKGVIHLLVGTTVIEVGVHVPRATIMIIEHPDRFGLAQLHQLRGRVGRGSERGICIMMSSKNLPEKTLSRLKILTENNDGFDIAQEDLELRGQGELTGMRQAGMGELDFSEMLREPKLLLEAKLEAQRLMEDDPELLRLEHEHLKTMIQSAMEKPLGL
jgi:ATP-dependent DNA helicase RecG